MLPKPGDRVLLRSGLKASVVSVLHGAGPTHDEVLVMLAEGGQVPLDEIAAVRDQQPDPHVDLAWAHGVKATAAAYSNCKAGIRTRLKLNRLEQERVEAALSRRADHDTREELRQLRAEEKNLAADLQLRAERIEAYEKSAVARADRVLGLGDHPHPVRRNDMSSNVKAGKCTICGCKFAGGGSRPKALMGPATEGTCPRCACLVVGKKPSGAATKKAGRRPDKELLAAARQAHQRWLGKQSPAAPEPERDAAAKPKAKGKAKQKAKRPSRFSVVFPLLQKGATRKELERACLAADEAAGIVSRAKPDILAYLSHFRHGRAAAYPGNWDVIVKGTGEEATYKLRARKDDRPGETIRK